VLGGDKQNIDYDILGRGQASCLDATPSPHDDNTYTTLPVACGINN